MYVVLLFFFFKQKTAYDLRISDWSSDVCSSDLRLYGGWYDGDPANILPAHSEEIAAALIAATGAEPILARARKLREDGELQLACHLTDFVRKGDRKSVV